MLSELHAWQVEESTVCFVFAEPLNIVGIVGTIVSLLLLGLAIISGLMLYYSPVFCWKCKDFLGPFASLSGFLKGCGWGKEAPVMLPLKTRSIGFFMGNK